MSEFYFDYKCISMGRQTAARGNDKALRFFLFQNYEEKGESMCVQVYIPRSMQKQFTAAKVYFSVNDIGFPDIIGGDLKPEIWYCGKSERNMNSEAHYINTDNSIYIKGDNGELSGCGVIAFVENGEENAPPKEVNCYKFIVNYSKKEIISYRILETKKRIRVQVIYPLIRKPIELCVIQKGSAKPVLVKDRENVIKKKKPNDEPETITLEATGRVEDAVKKSIAVQDASKYDYRLAFCDPQNNKFYLLVDESDYTMEDKSRRKQDRKIATTISLNAPKCPYCGRAIVQPLEQHKRGQTLIVGCDGQVISRTTEDNRLKGKLTVVCSEDLIAKSASGGADSSYIRVNHLILPDRYAERPSMNLAVAGFPTSGKTIFLSSLFNMQDGGTARGIESYPFILNRILKVFDRHGKNDQTVSEIRYNNVDVKNGCVLSETCERSRSSSLEDIKKRYVMSVGGNVEGQTKKVDAAKLSWYPVGFRIGSLGHTFFYDVPGEMFEAGNADKIRALDMADCLLAVIDGAPEKTDPVGDLRKTLERIPSLSHNDIDMKTLPIAVVFTKHDLKLTEYADEKGMEFCFDENCHVVRENIIDMLPQNGVYKGSELERHIECSSYELEHYLRARAGDGVFDKLKSDYKNIKFFTCSALGSGSCLGDPNNGTKEVLYKPRRLRIELPIIWLMYKKGLIKR